LDGAGMKEFRISRGIVLDDSGHVGLIALLDFIWKDCTVDNAGLGWKLDHPDCYWMVLE